MREVSYSYTPAVELTPEQIAANQQEELKREALDILVSTDNSLPRSVEDLADVMVGKGWQLPADLSNKIAAKKAARSAYLSL